MFILRYLGCVALALCPATGNAQPLFHSEYRWTVTIDERQYGLQDVIQTPGDFRWTQVWFADASFSVNLHIAEAAVAALFQPVTPVILTKAFSRRPDWRWWR